MNKKIIGITTIGTYYSPWFPYTLASIYKVCDEIIVANGGFDLENIELGKINVPLNQATVDIKHLDVDKKITELKDFSLDDLRCKFTLATQYDCNTGKLPLGTSWADIRGINMTIAQETAVKHGATHILKIDTDQVCYQDVEQLLTITGKTLDKGWVFYQYEFTGDGAKELLIPAPHSPYNDSVFIYKAHPKGHYHAGGSPAVYAPRQFCSLIHCAHLRYANPFHLGAADKLWHFYGRAWYERWTNAGMWGEDLHKIAFKTANNLLKTKGTATNFKPPEATFHMDPLYYIMERKK